VIWQNHDPHIFKATQPKAPPVLDTPSTEKLAVARDWTKLLAPYRTPDARQSIIEIVLTAVPFLVLWGAAYVSLSVSYWLTLFFCVLTSLFLVRLFLIQHDCGHGSFFERRESNDWVGRTIGVLTMTPYQVWRHSHAKHHAGSGNLDRRGHGDIDTLTVREYRAMTPLQRLLYRIYRFPPVMFGIGPVYVFMLKQRLPFDFMKGGLKFWISAMGTNVALVVLWGSMIWLVGWKEFLMVHLPVCVITGAVGIWLFYVQHQFEDSYWAESHEWTVEEAALYGSSHYDLPQPFRWLTANIGVHHVHHLYSRIPYYKLQKVMRDFPELASIRRFGFIESLACLRVRFWDEELKRMVSIREVGAGA
jgi:acyl-lipid omega-6 desaturase (Delta-12 desaturase)